MAWAWMVAAPVAAAEPAVLLQCTFDRGLAADRTGGRGEPLDVTGAEVDAGGVLRLPEAAAAAHVSYPAAGNFSAAAGAVEMTVRLDWSHADGTSRAKRIWFDIGGGDNRNRFYLHSLPDALVFGIFDDTGAVHAVYAPGVTAWATGESHRVTCAWDLARRYVAIALDGIIESDQPTGVGTGSWRIDEAAIGIIHIGGWGNATTPLGGSVEEFTILNAPPRLAARTAEAPAPDRAELANLQRSAARALHQLEKAIEAAEKQGRDASYADTVATAARIGMWRQLSSPAKAAPADVRSWCDYMVQRCPAAVAELGEIVAGTRAERRVPRPDVFELKVEGDGFRDRKGREVLLVGARNTAPDEFAELARYFNLIAWNSAYPRDWIERSKGNGYAGQAHLFWNGPMNQAVKEHPELRVEGGWCGHNWAMNLCIDTPRARQMIEKSVTSLRVLQSPPDPAAAYMLLSAEDEYMCWCAASVRRFQGWLEERYGNVAALNRSWGVEAQGFDQAQPPRLRAEILNPPNRAAWYDWQQFNRARSTAFYAWLKSLVRRTWPAIPVCGGTHLHLADNRWGTHGVDPEGLNLDVNDVVQCETMYDRPTRAPARALPPYGLDIHAEALLDFQRSTSGKPATDLEFHGWLRYTEALQKQHGQLPPNYTYAVMLRHYLHGIRAANVWVWDRSPTGAVDASSFACSPTIPLGAVEELLRAALDIRRLTPEILALSRCKRQVGILVSDASMMQIHPSLARSPHLPAPVVMELDNVGQGTMFLDAAIGYVSERSIARGVLNDYRVILVPAIDHLDDRTYAALLEFVERGGHLIITPRSLAFDEHHRARGPLLDLPKVRGFTFVGLLRAPTAEQLADEDWVQRQTADPADPRTPSCVLQTTGQAPFADGAVRLEGAGIRLQLEGEEAEVVARFVDDAAPAIVRRERGRGAIEFCAVPLRPQDYARLLEAVMREAGVERLVRLRDVDGEAVWGVEARSCRVGDDVLVYAVNLLAGPVEFELVTDAPIVAVHDHLTDGPGSARVRLAGMGVAVLRLKIGS